MGKDKKEGFIKKDERHQEGLELEIYFLESPDRQHQKELWLELDQEPDIRKTIRKFPRIFQVGNPCNPYGLLCRMMAFSSKD